MHRGLAKTSLLSVGICTRIQKHVQSTNVAKPQGIVQSCLANRVFTIRGEAQFQKQRYRFPDVGVWPLQAHVVTGHVQSISSIGTLNTSQGFKPLALRIITESFRLSGERVREKQPFVPITHSIQDKGADHYKHEYHPRLSLSQNGDQCFGDFFEIPRMPPTVEQHPQPCIAAEKMT